MQRLILRSFQSPGDVVMLTAAVRDLHAAYPGRFQTDVRTSADALWEHNPHINRLAESDAGVRVLEMHYPLIHHSNQRPYHFLHGYAQYLEHQLDLRIPVTRFHGDMHLSTDEKQAPAAFAGTNLPERYWIIVAGGKYDFTAKWWNPANYQAVVNHFGGQIHFVQCGEAGHWHPPLTGVTNLVGRTTLREFVRLMYHAEGVVCPVTFAMHLSAAVETRPGRPRIRPCVVIAGGREPAHWEAYPSHQYLSTNGALTCCAAGGCWKSRCQLVGDGDAKDTRDVCEQPVQITPDLRIARCMDLITPADVIRRIDWYFAGGALANGHAAAATIAPTADTAFPTTPPEPRAATVAPVDRRAKPEHTALRVSFHHGLGDCVYFAHLIPLYTRRGFEVEVVCTPDKRVLFEAAGARTRSAGPADVHAWGYPPGGTFEGPGQFWQGSKMGHNISHPPLPDIGDQGALWDEYCQVRLDIDAHLAAADRDTVSRWLEPLPRPVVLLHSKGNTAQQRKSLPDALAADFYRHFLDQCDGSLLLLDWDNRVPRLASYRVRHLDEFGPCPTSTLLALFQQADLLVGVDSGPLHAARCTRIPTLGIWQPGHYPTTYSLPRSEQLNVVLAEGTQRWNKYKRIPWNIVEHPGREFEARRLAAWCRQLLEPPRYLNRTAQAADVQLQQWVRDWCRGDRGNALASYCDRQRSFDVLLREMTARFPHPTVVETGTIRAEEDWAGAGFFTYLMGAYLFRLGGTLHSVDCSASNCEFARSWTRVFGETVRVVHEDSVRYLATFEGPIDVLYLDSLDTTVPDHAEHALRELEAAYAKLHPRSLVLCDDTPWHAGAWVGKGARVVPWLLARGWRVRYGGYQVLLERASGG